MTEILPTLFVVERRHVAEEAHVLALVKAHAISRLVTCDGSPLPLGPAGSAIRHVAVAALGAIEPAPSSPEHPPSGALSASASAALVFLREAEAARASTAVVLPPDTAGRSKSTRLNSSHLGISRMPSSA